MMVRAAVVQVFDWPHGAVVVATPPAESVAPTVKVCDPLPVVPVFHENVPLAPAKIVVPSSATL